MTTNAKGRKPVQESKSEAERYDRLAKEARNQTTSAQTPEYYEKKAAEARKKEKDTVKESAKNNLAYLIESELDKAEVVLAAQGVSAKLQDMYEKLAKIESDDIMPILDNMRQTFGPELTDAFNDMAVAKIRQTMDAVKNAKESITNEVSRLEGVVNGEQVNDMGMDVPPAAPEADIAADAPMDDGGDLGDELGAAVNSELPGDDFGGELDGDAAADDLDAAFNDSGDTAAGRAKKESVERNVKALRESKNPDALIYAVFSKTLKESGGQVQKTAFAVAEAFDIDVADVVTVVKEGKTRKDQVGKKTKDDDYKAARKEKAKKNNFGDDKEDLDEGKTRKDQAGKKDKDDDYKAARKSKAGGRKDWDADKEDLEEGKTRKDQVGKKDKNDDYRAARKEKAKKNSYGDDKDDLDESKKSFSEGGVAGKPSDALNEELTDAEKKIYQRALKDAWLQDTRPAEQKKIAMKAVLAHRAKASKVEESAFNRFKPRKGLSDYRTRARDVASQEQAVELAQNDYKSHLSRTMEVPVVYYFENGEVQQINSHLNDPIVVRVEQTDAGLLQIWHGTTLEPRWRVSIHDGKGVVPRNIKRAFIDAPAYRVLPQRPR